MSVFHMICTRFFNASHKNWFLVAEEASLHVTKSRLKVRFFATLGAAGILLLCFKVTHTENEANVIRAHVHWSIGNSTSSISSVLSSYFDRDSELKLVYYCIRVTAWSSFRLNNYLFITRSMSAVTWSRHLHDPAIENKVQYIDCARALSLGVSPLPRALFLHRVYNDNVRVCMHCRRHYVNLHTWTRMIYGWACVVLWGVYNTELHCVVSNGDSTNRTPGTPHSYIRTATFSEFLYTAKRRLRMLDASLETTEEMEMGENFTFSYEFPAHVYQNSTLSDKQRASNAIMKIVYSQSCLDKHVDFTPEPRTTAISTVSI